MRKVGEFKFLYKVADNGCNFIFSKAQLTRFIKYHVLSSSMSACVLHADDVADSC